MKYFLKNPNSNFYVSLLVCGVAVFILIPQNASAGKTINNPPLKVFIPNIKDDSESAKLLSFGAERLDYYPEKAEVTATGNVDIEDDQKIIFADSLNYEQKNGELTANGNVVVLEPDGKVNFVDNIEIKDKTKLSVVKKLKTKLAKNPSFVENEEIAKASAENNGSNSEEPSIFDNLFAGVSDTKASDANASELANLEPAAGNDSPIPQPTPANIIKPEVGNVPLISLPTTDTSAPKVEKTDSSTPASATPTAVPTPASPTPPASTNIPATVPTTTSVPPAIINDPAVKSAPTVAVDATPLPKVETPQKADIIPDVSKFISSETAKISLPNSTIPITNPNSYVEANKTDNIGQEETKPKKKKIRKKSAIIQPKEETSDVNTPKQHDSMATNEQQQADTSQASQEDSLSDESKKILDKVSSKAIATHSKSSPSKIDIQHQHTMGGLLKAGEAPIDITPNPALGVKVENKEQKLNIDYELEKAYDQINSGQSTAAIETYKSILDNSPNNTQALFGLATLYHRARQLDKARPLYSKLLAIEPDNRDGFNNFLVLLADEAPHEALIELEKLEAKNPGFSTIPAQIAVIYQKMGDLDKATDKMFRAVSLAPENLTYRYNLAVMMDKQKNYDEAAKLYKQLIEAADRGEKIPGNIANLQQRLTFISSNK